MQQATQTKRNVREEINPISLNYIDECNKWLVGENGDDNHAKMSRFL